MIKIGQKVKFNKLVGYIVGINIDPIEEIEVNLEAQWGVTYTIRVFKNFYKNGYADFQRCAAEFEICE